MEDFNAQEYPGLSFNDQEAQRLAKLAQLGEAGIRAYPPRFRRTHTTQDAIAAFEAAEPSLAEGAAGPRATVAGRVVGRRVMGKASFAHIQDGAGRLQLFFRQDDLQEPPFDYDFFKKMLDLGDHIGAEGFLFRTRAGEVSLHVQRFVLLAKALTPLPEKWHGLQDTETRYRQRYLDLISNEESRRIFRLRSAVVSGMRRYLDGLGFLEVETPVLQPLYGGATARPFITHHNTLDQDLYLRIADELYLKRLIVGGFDKVYEIGHDFRNEGVDTTHNPEFTMMECYQAYADYHTMMDLVEGMVSTLAHDLLGTYKVTYHDQEIDLTPPWRRVTMRDALHETSGLDFADYYDDYEGFYQRARDLKVPVEPGMTWAQVLQELVEHFVEPTLINPTFLTDYSAAISPLAKRTDYDPHLVERFEPFVCGFELGNAFSELNDPLEQYRRFAESAAARRAGDEEAHQMDIDFVRALMVGMPPTGGLGMGVDRLVMLLSGQYSIRDVVLFPHMRNLPPTE